MAFKTVGLGLPDGIIEANCTSFPGASVSIQLPGPGTVVVSSSVAVEIERPGGGTDQLILFLGTSETDCDLDIWPTRWQIPPDVGGGPHLLALFVQEVFPIAAAGTDTFYLNARMVIGASSGDQLSTATMIAIFYPS
jgi:hypothetical protein